MKRVRSVEDLAGRERIRRAPKLCECGRPIVVRGFRSGKNRNRMKGHDLCEPCWSADVNRRRP